MEDDEMDYQSIPFKPVKRLQCWPWQSDDWPSLRERIDNGDCDE